MVQFWGAKLGDNWRHDFGKLRTFLRFPQPSLILTFIEIFNPVSPFTDFNIFTLSHFIRIAKHIFVIVRLFGMAKWQVVMMAKFEGAGGWAGWLSLQQRGDT